MRITSLCALLALTLLLSPVLSVVASSSALLDSSPASDGSEAGYPRTITDSAGRTVTVTMPVSRIIVLNSDAAEAVEMLGAGDEIVGVTDAISGKPALFPELVDCEVVGTWKEFDYEQIGTLAMGGSDQIVPDIVVIGYTYPDLPYGIYSVEAGLAPFEKINAVGLDLYKQEILKDEIRTLGVLLGREDEAEAYCKWCDEKEDEVKSAVEGLDAPRVYIESSSKGGIGSLSSYGNGSALNDLCRIAGGENIGSDLVEYPKVEWEWVVSENPDVILKIKSISDLGWSDVSELEAEREEIMTRPGAEEISAVQNGKVYVCYWSMHFGLDSVVGLTYWARIFHPEVDLDPEMVHQEYLALLDFEYPRERVFVYPEI
jgi:iron complex transport system substrate-binding protein